MVHYFQLHRSSDLSTLLCHDLQLEAHASTPCWMCRHNLKKRILLFHLPRKQDPNLHLSYLYNHLRSWMLATTDHLFSTCKQITVTKRTCLPSLSGWFTKAGSIKFIFPSWSQGTHIKILMPSFLNWNGLQKHTPGHSWINLVAAANPETADYPLQAMVFDWKTWLGVKAQQHIMVIHGHTKPHVFMAKRSPEGKPVLYYKQFHSAGPPALKGIIIHTLL